ncbi:MAG: UDP-N-acetylmuramoyl-tripeptide--D-alanyl-D-alanine ligase [Parachlamydiales bacterium]|jgi:UDP-N-acetylmuramoyl-tripeptide--D-alanyl-D-alanine ligase
MNKLIKKVINLGARNYQIDSRLVNEKDLFFALKGARTDGHLYLRAIAKEKALAAVINKDYYVPQDIDIELIRVDNVLSFLQNVATEALKKSRAKKIGITGSFAKTTTKEFIATLLNGKFKVSKTYKNYNSQAGFPIAILNIDKDVDFLVLEMGMEEKGEIAKLVNIAPLDIALITQLLPYHNIFENIDDLSDAKKEIFSNQDTKIKLINKKISHLKAFSDDRYLTFSTDDEMADFYLDIENQIFYEFGKKVEFKLPFNETHFLENLSSAVAVCRLCEMSYDDIFEGFKSLKAFDLRFEKVYINDVLFIKDCYNANPISTIAALKNIPKTKGKKIAVLGSNLGLGKYSKEDHLKIYKVAKENVDEILCYGNEWEEIDNILLFSDHESLAKHLNQIMKKDDVVLIKGSRSMELEKIFNFIN